MFNLECFCVRKLERESESIEGNEPEMNERLVESVI